MLYILISVLLAIISCHFTGTDATSRPHIVMIVADDLGWDDVSFHGSSQIPTPNIDALANNGVILNSYYVSPICTPTRASFMTGKHPVNLGIQHGTIFATQPYGLPLGETTTPQYLKSLGYTTRGVGKWHLGFFEKEYTPTNRGFDSFYGFWTGKTDYWTHRSYEDYWGLDLRDNMEPVTNESSHYNTDLFTDVAEKIIAGHNTSTPLFLYIAHQAVHSGNIQEPLQAPKRLIDKFSHFLSHERRTYAAMVASLDESVGRVTNALKTKGMFDNSVIVFTTDNGGAPAGFDWSQGCNYPFKGGKDTLWEGGVRGVAFVHSAMIEKKGRVSYDLIDATDWLPTFFHLAGGDVTTIQDKIDGMNVWDTIAKGTQSPRSEVLHNIDPVRKFASIRVDQYKLVVNQDAVFRTTWHPRYAVRGEPGATAKVNTLPGAIVDCGLGYTHQTVECKTDVFPCLFDLSKDPCEYHNIAHANLPIVRKLLNRIFEHQKRALPVWYPDRDPLADPALLGDSWGPWKSISAGDTLTRSQNGEEKTASYMGNEMKPNENFGVVNGSQSLNCCHKYNLNYSSFTVQSDKDEKIYNVIKNIITSNTSMNNTNRNNSSRLTATPKAEKRDCCHSDINTGHLDDSQVEKCCLRSRITFADEISIQTAKDKQVYDVLHEILNIPEVVKRDVVGNKRTALRNYQNKKFQTHNKKHEQKHSSTNSNNKSN